MTQRRQTPARMDLANALCLPLVSIAAYIVRMRQVVRKLTAAAVIPIVCK